MRKNLIKDAELQIRNKEDMDGYGCPRAWVVLPTKDVAEITQEDVGQYSALLHDKDGYPKLPMINADNLDDLFAAIISDNHQN